MFKPNKFYAKMTTNIVKLTKPQNFPESSTFSYFKKSPHSDDGGVSTVDLSNKERDRQLKSILQSIHEEYGLKIYSERKENSAFEVMAATYITPHNDDDFLVTSPWREKGLKEFQLLIPLSIPESGYDVYIMDKQTKKIVKTKTEIGVPFVFDYDQIHWTLPSKLTSSEKALLDKITAKLVEFPSKDFNNRIKFNRLLNQVTNAIDKHKNYKDSTLRWNEPSSVQFLASRVFADPNLNNLLTIDKVKSQSKGTVEAKRKKLKP